MENQAKETCISLEMKLTDTYNHLYPSAESALRVTKMTKCRTLLCTKDQGTDNCGNHTVRLQL
jgi:hypothetical protein